MVWNFTLAALAGWPTLRDKTEAAHPARFSKGEVHRSRKQTMINNLQDLLEVARNVVLTPEEKGQQRPIRLLPFGQSPSTALGASAKPGRLSHPIPRKPRVLGTPVSDPASLTAMLQSRIRVSRA